MKLSLSILATAALCVQETVAANSNFKTQDVNGDDAKTEEKYGSRGWIVELDAGSSIAGAGAGAAANRRRQDNKDHHHHADFHRRASAMLTDYSVRREFTNPGYFYGVAIDARDDDDAALLSSIPGVKNVWPNRLIPRPEPIGVTPVEDQSSSSSSSSSIGSPSRLLKANETVVHITGDSDVLSSLKMGNVDKVHSMNITGEGVKVAVIDSGVDYRHPALGGGFGEGFKITQGYDLVGDEYTGLNERVPDEDPLVTCLAGAHGTHVSGIIGARDPENVGYGIVGVAPDAELSMYKVFGCAGSTQDDVMLDAFEMAGEGGPDVISVSIGQDTFWESGGLYDSTFAALQEQGIAVIISAGNSGGAGLFVASEPASSPNAIAIGSVANTKFVTTYHAAASDGETIEYSSVVPLADATHDFHVLALSAASSPCTEEAWLNATANFPEKERIIVAVAADATCYQYQIRELAEATGIDKVFQSAFAGFDLSATPAGSEYAEYTVYGVLPSTLNTILKGIEAQGDEYVLTFADQEVHDSAQVNAGAPDSFSSYGPTMEMSLKPQLSAPGGNILSTWPITGGIGYAVVSGTSMAAPYTAGVYALVKQSNPDLGPLDILGRLQSTSTPLKHSTEDLLSATAKQGSGLVNALDAISATTVLEPTEINLRDSSSPVTSEITIENKSDKTQIYTLSHQGAAAMETWADVYNDTVSNPFRFRETNLAEYATADFSHDTIELEAGAKATFDVTFTPPASNLDPFKMPVYGGYVNIEAVGSDDDTDDKSSFVIPYLGVPYKRSDYSLLSVPDNVTYYSNEPSPPEGVPRFPYIYAQDTSVRNNDKVTYTFPAANSSVSNNDPIVTILTMQPSDYMRIDVVPVDTDFAADHYGFDRSIDHDEGDIIIPDLDVAGLDAFLDVPSYGSIMTVVGGYDKPKTPYQVAGRGIGWIGGSWLWATVALDNGTVHQLPNADYRILVRAKRAGFAVDDPAGYESWLSPIVGVNITSDLPNPQLPGNNGTAALRMF